MYVTLVWRSCVPYNESYCMRRHCYTAPTGCACTRAAHVVSVLLIIGSASHNPCGLLCAQIAIASDDHLCNAAQEHPCRARGTVVADISQCRSWRCARAANTFVASADVCMWVILCQTSSTAERGAYCEGGAV
jgi:hypothetical protein